MRPLLATVILLSAAAVPGQSFVPTSRTTSPTARHSVRQQRFEGTWLAEIVSHGIFGDDARLAGSVQDNEAGSEILQATADGMQLRLQLDAPPASFEGAMHPEGSQIVGKWTQDGDDCWLVFRRL
jgi:hypothetical protein